MIKKIEHWFHHHYDFIGDKSISAFRVLYAFFFLFVGAGTYERISQISTSLYKPRRSLAKWFDLPNTEFFIGIDYVLLISLVCLLFGFRTRLSSLVVGITLIVGNSFEYGFGKISHGDLFLIFVPLVMAFSNWGRFYSVDEKLGKTKEVVKWPVTLMSVVIGFGMMTAGLQKLIGGWLNIEFQAIRFHLYKSYLNLREGPLTQLFVDIQSFAFWEVMDYVIVFFELGFLVAVINYKLFRGWIVAALFFHVGVFLIFDITFSKNVIAYFLFLDWVVIMYVLKVEKALNFMDRLFTFTGLVTGLALFLGMKIFLGNPFISLHLGLNRLTSSLFMFLIAFIVIGVEVFRRFILRKT